VVWPKLARKYEMIRKSGRVVWKNNSDRGDVMGVVHVLCKVVNEGMKGFAFLLRRCMHART
jgi:hypothetical protein